MQTKNFTVLFTKYINGEIDTQEFLNKKPKFDTETSYIKTKHIKRPSKKELAE